MVKHTHSKNHEAIIVDDDRIILFNALFPLYHENSYREFPRLNRTVYEWSKKNKCLYRRTYHLRRGKITSVKAIMFKDVTSAEKFKKKWVNSVLDLPGWLGQYDFMDPCEASLLSKEARKWIKQNKIKVIRTDYSYILFATAEDAMAFKLRWA